MHSELGVEVRRRMREAREAAKFTQAEVATELGVSRQVVTSWESGRSAPNPVQVARLCVLYGVSTDSVLVGVEPTAAKNLLQRAMRPKGCTEKR